MREWISQEVCRESRHHKDNGCRRNCKSPSLHPSPRTPPGIGVTLVLSLPMISTTRFRWLPFLSVVLALGGSSTQVARAQGSQAFINGQWFDGNGFRAGDRYIVDGVFSSTRPAKLDLTTDLAGAFVVPPFAEAHNHNVESSRIDAVSKMYLDRGDGLYQSDGQALAVPPPVPARESQLLSDRPTRTDDKTRITLERATFA